MQRGIDHLVICVRNMQQAQSCYEALGFTLTPRALHPFGTANRLVQLQGNFLELLCIADPGAIEPSRAGVFSFGEYNRRFLEVREGMSMLVFASDDARRDHAGFVERGLTTYAPFDFERQAQLPDGSEVTVGFSLAFVTDAEMPEAAFFVCQQHAPQHFWKRRYQAHANTALAVNAVIMLARDPGATRDFFTRLLDEPDISEDDGALQVQTLGGRLEVLTERAFRARYPGTQTPEGPATPFFAGYRVAVADLDRARACLLGAGVSIVDTGEALRTGPSETLGMMLEFVAVTAP